MVKCTANSPSISLPSRVRRFMVKCHGVQEITTAPFHHQAGVTEQPDMQQRPSPEYFAGLDPDVRRVVERAWDQYEAREAASQRYRRQIEEAERERQKRPRPQNPTAETATRKTMTKPATAKSIAKTSITQPIVEKPGSTTAKITGRNTIAKTTPTRTPKPGERHKIRVRVRPQPGERFTSRGVVLRLVIDNAGKP